MASCCDGTGERSSINTTQFLSLDFWPWYRTFRGFSASHQLEAARGTGCFAPEAFVLNSYSSGFLSYRKDRAATPAYRENSFGPWLRAYGKDAVVSSPRFTRLGKWSLDEPESSLRTQLFQTLSPKSGRALR